MKTETGGRKDDGEKVRLDLLSSRWVMGVGAVLTFGAHKYAAHNWRKGLAISRLLGACLRHVFAFVGGEDRDPETQLSHLYHASCCLMFASELHETRPDLDDRYKTELPKRDVGAASAPQNPVDPTPATVTVVQADAAPPPPTAPPVEGEWIQVEVDGQMHAAFKPNMVAMDKLPNVYFDGVMP